MYTRSILPYILCTMIALLAIIAATVLPQSWESLVDPASPIESGIAIPTWWKVPDEEPTATVHAAGWWDNLATPTPKTIKHEKTPES
jgi:hypothetical protein